MSRPMLKAVDVDSLDLDLPEQVLGPNEWSILDEEEDGVGLTVDYRSADEDAVFAIFVNCRPTMPGDPAFEPDPEGGLLRALTDKRGIGHEAEGSVRIIAGIPAHSITSRIEDLHEEELYLVTGDRLFQAHASSEDAALTRAAMALVEEKLLPQFLGPA